MRLSDEKNSSEFRDGAYGTLAEKLSVRYLLCVKNSEESNGVNIYWISA